ncbi:helix-hairpin-helix domain-containing protein [Streptococcus caballi]|uniref:helix-hairpin-helix domain-containing protein n=1 Tax=Streptococcus caballi TaxID=439220 RepID=UPI000377AD27|nr:helix-hairpin-helix domain-containing protein [Streptococcus caballi]
MLEVYMEKCRDLIAKNKLVAGLLGSLLVLVLGFVIWTHFLNPSQPVSANITLLSTSQSTDSSQTAIHPEQSAASASSANAHYMVDVKGAVNKEGVYSLPADSRVTDAIKAAGGFNGQADKKSVNLAQKISDEQVIYVASQGEAVSVISSPSASSESTLTGSSADKINLNTATLADLQTISGIGAKRAQDILDYRDSNGGFKSVDDLKNVSGIGDKTLEKLKVEVTID